MLGAKLQDLLRGPQPIGTPPFNPQAPSMQTPSTMPMPGQAAPEKKGFLGIKPDSKGAIIAGIIGDALARATGGQAVAVPMMLDERRRKSDMEAQEVQWSRRREAELADWQRKQEWERQNPAPSPMVRDISAWMQLGPQEQAAFQAMQEAKAGPITTTLPNGQLYVGPRSGLADALGAGQAPQAGQVPQAPVGKLRPIQGGPTPPASGNFPIR